MNIIKFSQIQTIKFCNFAQTCNFMSICLYKAVATGIMRRLERYIDRNFEIATRKVRELQTSGQNVTQWDYIINMNNYNVLQHGCVPCK